MQSEMDSEVYLRLPPDCGFMSSKIVSLNKSLKGLKQASKQWYHLLVGELEGYWL